MGQEDTCDYSVCLSNKQNRAQITDVMVHDNAAPPPWRPAWQAWENCLDALPHHLWPDVPAVGDRLYVGIRTTAAHPGPFSNVIFDIDFPYSDMPTMITSMNYLYFDSLTSVETPFPANTYYDETAMFSQAGKRGFYFMPPPTMGHDIINGIDMCYICFLITGVAGAGASPRMADQVHRPVYTVNTAYFDILESSAGGDIPAIAKSKIQFKNLASLAVYQSFYLSVRSIARGIDFSPYLNCTSDVDQIPGLTVTAISADSSFIQDNAGLFVGSPTGHVGLYNPAGPRLMAQRFVYSFDDTLASQYSGKFAFYLRYRITSAIDPDFSVKLKFNWGSMLGVFTDEVAIPPLQKDSVYLGTYDLTFPYKKSERFAEYDISIYLSAVNGTGGSLMIYDLILVPVDEIPVLVKCMTPPGYFTPSAHPEQTGVVIDSIGYPKDLVRVFFMNVFTDDLSASLEYFLSGIWQQQTGHQRIWYFSFGGDNIRTMHLPIMLQQYVTNRYALGMRGTQ
jgi:hypothetical protein